VIVGPGSRLGPYEIVAQVGAGGMGEVWRARDTRLGRDVAVKVLPERLASDAEALARFEREARAVAALSHPHIVALFDIGHDGGTAYLVMELLAGESLAARLARGPVPLGEAVGIAVQVAEALAAAHRQGVVHRDLKPGNVMLTRGGVKLLDFGLAKRSGPTSRGTPAGWTQLPTAEAGAERTPLTAEGSLLGTLQYMAPEQLEGREVDARADLFAFGAMLYEMVTGARAFPGATPASVIAAILKDEPRPIAELQPLAPPALERLVRRCLAKDPDDRWQSAADVAEALAWIDDAPTASTRGGRAALEAAGSARGSRRRRTLAVASGLALVALGIGAGWLAAREPGRSTPLRVALPAPNVGDDGQWEWVELSPDGTRVAYLAEDGHSPPAIWVRDLATQEPRRLAGTEGAEEPFWSPDSHALGFYAGGKLRKVPLDGGPSVAIADSEDGWGGSWGSSGQILFTNRNFGGLAVVSEDGGAVRELTKPRPDEEGHRWPCFLPDGDHFVFLADSSSTAGHRIWLGSLRGGPPRPLVEAAISNPRFLPPDRLLYVRGGSLLVQRIDVGAAKLVGGPVAVADHLWENEDNHHFEFSVAPGFLTWRSVDRTARFVWVDRHDVRREPVGEAGPFEQPALSGDQRRLAYIRLDADGRREGLWWRDLVRGIDVRLVRASDPGVGTVDVPVISPDGGEVLFAAAPKGAFVVMRAPVDLPAPARPLLARATAAVPGAWSPDGRWILYVGDDKTAVAQIWVIAARDAAAEPQVWVWGRGAAEPAFSPDGRWVAYTGNLSEQAEVYVAPFSGPGAPVQVSVGGGEHPTWRGDGRELFYLSASRHLTAVPIELRGGGILPGAPAPLFPLRRGARPLSAHLLPSLDGQRFLAVERGENADVVPQHLVVGWQPP
jgi:Tol biopolymer transport system component